MTNAQKESAPFLLYPKDKRFSEAVRQFQGCPTIAVTKKGRVFLGWYSGGTREPHIDNYNLLICSNDGGNSWSFPCLVIESSREKCIHALDIQLWLSPKGELHVYWVQNSVTVTTDGVRPPLPETLPWVSVEGYDFGDFEHSMWMSVCKDPDADVLEFSEPRRVDKGFLRCKPLVLQNGELLAFNYDQLSDKYGYSISTDVGYTYLHRYGAEKIPTRFDEAMAYQRLDGSIRMLARSLSGYLAESISYDNGKSFEPASVSDIPDPSSRFFISRTPSGRVLLVYHDSSVKRTNLTVALSEDDGASWKYKRTIDSRVDISYPDADFYDGKIFLTYDRERTGAKEILFLTFTEEDIIDKTRSIEPRVVSKP